MFVFFLLTLRYIYVIFSTIVYLKASFECQFSTMAHSSSNIPADCASSRAQKVENSFPRVFLQSTHLAE